MVRVSTADNPLIFTDPQSLSFGYLVAGGGANSQAITVTVSDAGGGAGTWTAEVQAQVASTGATVEAAPVTVGPGGTAAMQIVARASAGAVQGDNFGFVVLRRGSDVRRIPYAFSVSRSSLTGAPVTALKAVAVGRHANGRGSRARLPLADVPVLHPRDLRRRPVGERRRQGEALLPRHPATGGERGRGGREAETEAERLHHRAAQLEPADPPLVPGLARREQRPRLRGNPRERERAAARLPVLDRHGGRRVPAAREVLRLGRLGPRSLQRPLARRPVHPPLVGQRREAADGQADHEQALDRAPDGRREDHATRSRASIRTRSSSSSVRLGPPGVGWRDALRPGDRDRRVLHPSRGAGARRRARSSCDSSRRTTRSRRTSTRSRRARFRTPLPGLPGPGREPADRDLDHSRERQVPRRAAEAARGRERQRPDLLGRLLRRQPPDRPRSKERRRALRADLAHGRKRRGAHVLTAIASDVRGREAEASRTVRICK